MNQHRKSIIEWNARFPLDRVYRDKHNIIFGSEQHRGLCQIDIFYDWLEKEMVHELREEIKDDEDRKKEYESGIWLRERIVQTKESEDLFNSINIEDIEFPDEI